MQFCLIFNSIVGAEIHSGNDHGASDGTTRIAADPNAMGASSKDFSAKWYPTVAASDCIFI